MITPIILTDSEKSKILEMGSCIKKITNITFDTDYGNGMLYIQQEGATKGEVIHWFEFCVEYLTKAFDHSWGEVEIDTEELCSQVPVSIVESLYRAYKSKMGKEESENNICVTESKGVNHNDATEFLYKIKHIKGVKNIHFVDKPVVCVGDDKKPIDANSKEGKHISLNKFICRNNIEDYVNSIEDIIFESQFLDTLIIMLSTDSKSAGILEIKSAII